VRYAEGHDDLSATAGVHPHDARHIQPDWWPVLEALAGEASVVGVGETGLDYHYDNSPRDVQRDAFERFAALAQRVDKPLVCHVRDAHDDAKAVLRAAMDRAPLRGVIHCFTGTPQDAADYAAMGLYISFSGIVTFRGSRSQILRDAVGSVPRERLMIETDCPYLAPQPVRGKRNEPAFVAHTAATLAELLEVPVEELGALTSANTRELFGLT
jgi:TatD DNase family protein